MEKYKKVTYRHLKNGQEIMGTEEYGLPLFFSAFVKKINPAYVTVTKVYDKGREEKISTQHLFLVAMTEEEFRNKYNKMAGKIVSDLQHSLHYDEIGHHEMDNSWLVSDPWELAQICKDKGLTIQGCCKEITPKISVLTSDVLDVGICVENKYHERFWCHFRSESIKLLICSYKRYCDWIAGGKKDTYELNVSKPPRRNRINAAT